ncbi:CocE/NonD family hydrolase [Acidisoma sp. S159]|uniref:CocE/NonD family hydrolase n=1 Tax=Acidisoma sp. S159 TaxID=1747225 RepID=UPI00131C9CB2|nr:CocE/NonD family hydrolase [Acidisoma sp. S159]
MQVVEKMPYSVSETENEWIVLADGTRLAARIWRPSGTQARFPAILEYLPYRKRDGTVDRDALTHPYFAGHGYACMRVDMRGSGESDGLLDDEYLKLEQDDALEVIDWIAAQPWCSGLIGMIGISWGGFNGLQVAARRPPALKAVVSICSTDDRYADDIHFMGGCLLNDNLAWSSTMLGYMSRPPDPALVGDRWRDMWLQRLEHEPLLAAIWLQHQRRDDYWKHGSICESFEDINCPVLAVGGWADGYSNAVPKLLAGLTAPCRGIIGPWAHKYPHFARPGPRIGFLQECLRWFDQHLAGRETGVMDEPMLRVWMQDWQEPLGEYEFRKGRWIAEPSWPSLAIQRQVLVLNAEGLRAEPGLEQKLDWCSPQDHGEVSGTWFSFGTGPDQPTDQLVDDGRALIFDTVPLEETLEILGAPVLDLEVAVDRPNAVIAVRLSDVSPDGGSLRVTYGVLNLTHRNSHERPEDVVPGARMRIRIALNDAAHRFVPGHRLRVAVATSYWPVIWPSAEPATLSLFTAASRLTLPVRKPRPEDAALAFQPAQSAPPLERSWQRKGGGHRRVTRDAETGESVIEVLADSGRSTIVALGLETESIQRESYSILARDPLSAKVDISYTMCVGRGAWQTRTETRTVMRATKQEFLLEASLDAYEGETRVLSRNWARRVPRDGV